LEIRFANLQANSPEVNFLSPALLALAIYFDGYFECEIRNKSRTEGVSLECDIEI